MKPQAGTARDRINHLQVTVNADERQRIKARAAAAGLSVSGYLRAAGLGQPVRSALDHAAVAELAKLNADQGRLGGVLTQWLADPSGRGTPQRDVSRLMDQIRDLQAQLAEIAGRV